MRKKQSGFAEYSPRVELCVGLPLRRPMARHRSDSNGDPKSVT